MGVEDEVESMIDNAVTDLRDELQGDIIDLSGDIDDMKQDIADLTKEVRELRKRLSEPLDAKTP